MADRVSLQGRPILDHNGNISGVAVDGPHGTLKVPVVPLTELETISEDIPDRTMLASPDPEEQRAQMQAARDAQRAELQAQLAALDSLDTPTAPPVMNVSSTVHAEADPRDAQIAELQAQLAAQQAQQVQRTPVPPPSA